MHSEVPTLYERNNKDNQSITNPNTENYKNNSKGTYGTKLNVM